MAVSAYACPGLSTGTAISMPMVSPAVIDGDAVTESAALEGEQATACDGMAGPMDTAFTNLCAEHCHHGQQSDQAGTLTVPSALLTALYITPPAPEPIVAPRPAANTTGAPATAFPPIAILHCCFRI